MLADGEGYVMKCMKWELTSITLGASAGVGVTTWERNVSA